VKRAHFSVVARLDAPALTSGTVTIDRGSGLFRVRPARRRRTYDLPLAAVADMVVARVIRAEVLERRAAKKRKA
jgi:hypothetical protein